MRPLDPHGPTTPSPPSNPGVGAPILLRPHCESFEHGLLPIPKLIFFDETLTLGPLRDKLVGSSSPYPGLVDTPALAEALQISPDHARLVLDTLASALPSDPPDPVGTADVYDLVLFLYIQTYKRLLPKPHKDSATIVDVDYSGAVCLKWRRTEVALREEAPDEVRIEYEELRTDVSALFLAAHSGHLRLLNRKG